MAGTPTDPSGPSGPSGPAGPTGPSGPSGLIAGPDGALRCAWCAATPAYRHYHDHEWGFAVVDDRRLFEILCLEGFQAGLSWQTILTKRPAFRSAFADFDAAHVARFGKAEIARLLADAGIVRHRGKIEATINNAQRLPQLSAEFGSFAAYVWRYEPAAATRPKRMTHAAFASLGASAEAAALSKDLKRRGFRFVGPTTIYAFMQASGVVNDHLERCHVRAAALQSRQRLRRESGGVPG